VLERSLADCLTPAWQIESQHGQCGYEIIALFGAEAVISPDKSAVLAARKQLFKRANSEFRSRAIFKQQ
jgi:hypothetical protein